jgi:hypothetical protein
MAGDWPSGYVRTGAMPVPDCQALTIHVRSASVDGEVRIGDVLDRLADPRPNA